MKLQATAIVFTIFLCSIVGWLSGALELQNLVSAKSNDIASNATIASATKNPVVFPSNLLRDSEESTKIISATIAAGSGFIWVPVNEQNKSASQIIYFVEGNTVFTGGSSPQNSGYALPGADPETLLVLIDDGSEVGLAKDNVHVYVGSELLSDADPTSITALPNDADGGWDFFFTDKNSVYYFTYEISGADPRSFSVLGTVISGEWDTGMYAKDATHVYFIQSFDEPQIVTGADASTFHLVYPDTSGDFLEEAPCNGCQFIDARDASHEYALGEVVQ